MDKMTEKFFDPLTLDHANMIPLLLDRMDLFGITRQELSSMYDEYILDRKKELLKQRGDIAGKLSTATKVNSDAKPQTPPLSNNCVVCKSRVRKYAINTSPGTMVGGAYTVAIMCTNTSCLHVKYI